MLNPPRRSPTAACFPLPRQHSDGSPTTSAVARPDGFSNTNRPAGLLIADPACFPLPRQHSAGAPPPSAVARPDGFSNTNRTAGLLIADLDLTEATGLLASRMV